MTGGTFPKFAKLSSHHAPRKRGWSGLGALFMLVTVAALVAWTPEAGAFDNWTDTATGDFDTNCAQCHGNFRSNGYVSLKDGSPWSTSLMNGHRDFVSGECDVCHNSGGRFPAYTLWSAGGTGFENISCAGCHGRGDNATPPAPGDNNQTCVEDPTAYGGDAAICGAGAGLRRQHWTANRTIDTANGPVSTQICATCHADADPANFTPVDEDVPPSYYFTPDPVHANKPTDPCNANPAAAGAESKFGPTGLDNDGDGLVDGADADCIAVNLPPVAVDDAYTTDEDTPLVVAAPGVLTNDSDPENDPITAVPNTGPASGSLTLNTDGSFSYTPNADFNGTDSFTYFANDGTSNSDLPATVTITVNAINDPPVAVNDSYTTDEDVPLNVPATGVLANDTDVDGDALTAVLVPASGPDNGSLTLNSDGSFTYTPNANFNGDDSFRYVANDGQANSNEATVTITVNAVNDPPVAVDDSYVTDEDVPLTVTAPGVLANDTDADGDTLTAALVTDVSNGTLALAADGSFSYTPDANFNGDDTFTYVANDGQADSNVATVTITVNAVNDPPVAVDDSYVTDEDVPLTVTAPGVLANDTDADGDTLTATLVTDVSNGTLALAADGSFSYTPDANFNGDDTFTYVANDGTVDSNVATVTITVNAVNDPPVAVDDSYVTDEDVPLTVTAPGVLANDTDADGDTLTAALVTDVSNGTLALAADGSFSYTPDANFNGDDTFTYVANDGQADSNVATVTITVNAVNDPPVAVDDSYTTDEDVTLTVTAPGVLANDTDADGDILTATLVTDVSNGTLALAADGSFSYTPDANFNGDDTFTYVANDGTVDSNVATVTITVNAVNDPPVADAGPDQAVQLNDTVQLDGSGSSDADGDPLTFAWSFVSVPPGSTATLSDPTVVNPTFVVDESGTYVVQLIVNDGTVASAPDTVTISTDNAPPVAVDDSYTTAEDTQLSVPAPGVLANDSDPDGDTMTAVLGTTTSNGALTLNPDGSFTYDPDPDFNGTDSFTYIANDGTLNSNTATVTITVTPVNDPPVADAGPDQTVLVNDTVTLDGSGSSDVDGDPLTFSWSFVSVPAGSGATLSDPTVVNPTFVVDLPGTYVVQLVVNDGTVDSAPDTVSITTGNSPPVADAGPDQTVLVNDTVTLDGSGSSDVDGDPLTFSWSFVSVPAGSGATLSDPTVVNPTFVVDLPGTYVVELIVNDGTVDSAPDTVNITTGNTAPVADAGPDQTVLVNDTVTLDGSGSSDVDGDPLTFSWSFVSVPAGSGATLSDPTVVNPTFVVDLPGTYVVQLVVNDGLVDSAPDTVSITTGNSAPVADAGPDQTVFVTDTVTLDGSGSSDVDGDLLTFAWSFTSVPAGSGATLSDPTVVNPTFFVDLPGTYVVQLVVNDGLVDSAPDSVTITTQNSPPVADAGPDQTAFVTDTVTLDGSGSSDVDGDLLTFAWSFTSVPAGSFATLSDPTAVNPTFVVDQPGTYVVQLIVNDGLVDSAPDTVSITTQNSAPVADPGPDQTAFVTDTVTLDGSASDDVDGDPLTYSWSLTSVPVGSFATLSDPTAVNPTFEVDEFGVYVAQLIVNDGTVDSAPVSVSVTTENTAPVANAGPDRTVLVGTTVVLNGSGSGDVDGDPLTFAWSLTSVPAGSGAVLSDPTAVTPSFDADLLGSYVAQLIVNDGTVDSAPDSVIITASATGPAGPDIEVSPLSVDYGPAVIGTRQFGFVTVQNLGDDNLTVTGLTMGGSLDFVLNTDFVPPFTIRPGRTEIIGVDYIPSDTGADGGTLDIASDDPDEPVVQVALSGSGEAGTPAIAASPPSVDYGLVVVGTRKFGFVDVENPGDGDLTVSGFTMQGSPEFVLNTDLTPPFVIGAGDTVTIGVDYIPVDVDVVPDSGDLVIESVELPDLSVPLSGTGAQGIPDIVVSPAAVDYGPVSLGTRAFGFVNVENLGDTRLTISGLAVTGSTEFELNTDFKNSIKIKPGRNVWIGVDYIPVGLNADAGTLEITSDDPDQPVVSVPLSGSGVP